MVAAYLRDYCVTMGVEHILDDVALDERGFVRSLALKERGDHAVEFVIDCSGFRDLIIRKVWANRLSIMATACPATGR